MAQELHAANLDLKNRFPDYKLVLGLAVAVVEALITHVDVRTRAHAHCSARRGLYCEIRPVFHRPDCRVLFTRIMSEVAVHFFVQFGNLRKSLVRYHTATDVEVSALVRDVVVVEFHCVVGRPVTPSFGAGADNDLKYATWS